MFTWLWMKASRPIGTFFQELCDSRGHRLIIS